MFHFNVVIGHFFTNICLVSGILLFQLNFTGITVGAAKHVWKKKKVNQGSSVLYSVQHCEKRYNMYVALC